MAVPKRRTSRSRQGNRRSHHHRKPIQVQYCPRCEQPALFVPGLAALESLKATQPEVVASCRGAAGLSLGEYTALVFAGALSFRDGLRVVQQRGEAMQAAADANPGAMVAVLGPDEA